MDIYTIYTLAYNTSMANMNDNNVCSICITAINDTDNVASLACTHRYHLYCILELFIKADTAYNICPYCRTPIDMPNGLSVLHSRIDDLNKSLGEYKEEVSLLRNNPDSLIVINPLSEAMIASVIRERNNAEQKNEELQMQIMTLNDIIDQIKHEEAHDI